ncbi:MULTISPECIES: LacI family DNA-binding transcriptional regulator [unclassified Streptomyces]|uniref:LacI family DNA-binding transcriptional regulator n=1 Tax=unclassified Streptomyces TaxID=2593676 RepID=UPI00278C5453|nr:MULTISPECIES: LacI family DNA-binding transcriptional regulator [unclassified Streptomyces]
MAPDSKGVQREHGDKQAAKKAGKPVMADVARAAGVSHQTVSRVLNGSPQVLPETRERVLAAVEQLGYRRNRIARALAMRRSGAIGVLTHNAELYGRASTFQGLEGAAREAGHACTVISLRDTDEDRVAESVDFLVENGVDGLVLDLPERLATRAVAAVPEGVPLVITGRADDVCTVRVDNVAGAHAAVTALLDAGHDTVWHLAGPAGWGEAAEREEGWRTALRDAGRPVPELVRGGWSFVDGHRAAAALLDSGATAVFVANDHMALGLLKALHEAGVSVPERLSVVGFDDIPEAAWITPALSTVRQDFGALGQRAIDLLARAATGASGEVVDEVLVPTLKLRESSGPPPRR